MILERNSLPLIHRLVVMKLIKIVHFFSYGFINNERPVCKLFTVSMSNVLS